MKKFKLFAILLPTIMFAGCQGTSEPEPQKQPEIISLSASEISASSATLTAVASTDLKGTDCVFKLTDPNGTAKEYSATVSGNTMVSTVKGLNAGTKYKYKAAIDNLIGTIIYSKEYDFTTETRPPKEHIIINDPFLKRWLVARFDTDGDSELSYEEAKTVNRIEINADSLHTVNNLENFPNLEHLLVGGTCKETYGTGNLTEIDVTQNPLLRSLGLEGNKISKIDLSNNARLDYLSLSRNPIEEVSITHLQYLTLSGLSYTNIKTLDLRGMNLLDEMHLDGCLQLKEILLDNAKLRYLDCSK